MNYIVQFANDPNSLTPEQTEELKSEILQAVERKIENVENKYKIKFKLPKNICNLKNNDKLPLPIISTPIITNRSALYLPVETVVGDFSDEGSIDRLTSCLKIVNSVKSDLEQFNEGKITRSQINNTYFDWNFDEDCDEDKDDTKYKSEIEEMYEKKFSNKAVINELIEKLENTYTF
jgi:hypothetical protein